MAHRSRPTTNKRQREQARIAKRNDKAARLAAKNSEKIKQLAQDNEVGLLFRPHRIHHLLHGFGCHALRLLEFVKPLEGGLASRELKVTEGVVGFILGLVFAVLSYLYYWVAVILLGGALGYHTRPWAGSGAWRRARRWRWRPTGHRSRRATGSRP